MGKDKQGNGELGKMRDARRGAFNPLRGMFICCAIQIVIEEDIKKGLSSFRAARRIWEVLMKNHLIRNDKELKCQKD